MRTLHSIAFLLLLWMTAGAEGNPILIRLGAEKGLSNNSVQCVLQDRDGFLWFGTYDGLNRYDGYEFKVFRNKLTDSLSIPHNYIYSIYQDDGKNLWVGTGQGLCRYNKLGANFTPALFIPNKSTKPQKLLVNVNNMVSDGRGNLFIASNGAGLLVQRGEAPAIPVALKTAAGLSFTYSSTVAIDSRGQVWAFVDGEGLYRYDPASNSLQPMSSSLRMINTMVADQVGKLWLGTPDGLYEYAVSENRYLRRYTAAAGALTNNHIYCLAFDKKGQLWIGTEGGGLNILNPATGGFRYILPGSGSQTLSSETVSSICHDGEGRTWIGTQKGGVNLIDPQLSRFHTIAHDPLNPNSLVNSFAASFYEDGPGRLFIGTEGGGLSIWDRQTGRFNNYSNQPGNPSSLSNNRVSSILRDNRGHLWVATFGGGVNRFNPATGTFTKYPCYNPVAGIENNKAWLLRQDREGTLWATTFGNGKLYRFNYDTDRFEVFDQELHDLISFYQDKAGNLWAGNASSLIRIDRVGKKHRFYEMTKPVRALLEDAKGNFWVGTEGGGLILFDRDKQAIAARYTDAEGLCNNAVLNILQDERGLLWMSTFNGLSRFDVTTRQFANFYQSDGLQGNQFLYGAALKLQSGELVFGGINGFTLFSPPQVFQRAFMPPLAVTAIRVNSQPLSENPSYINATADREVQSLRIPYDDAVLAVDFAALEYSSPGKIKYAYYLEGWDKGWNYTTTFRTANYTNLREGTYTLRLKSTNAEGVWNDHETILKVTVLPPWYRSWWAYTIYALLMAGALWLYTNYRHRQSRLRMEVQLSRLNEKNERMARERSQALLDVEHAERLRTDAELALARAEQAQGETELQAQRMMNEKERELSDRKTNFFTSISHEFRTPLTLIINPIKDLLRKSEAPEEHQELKVVHHNAKRLLSLVDQLLIFRKAEEGMDSFKFSRVNFYSLCQEVYLYFVQQARLNHQTYIFTGDNTELELYVDREKMEIALFNLLSNAIKYTPDGGRIQFAITETEGEVQVAVTNTGDGVPAEAIPRLFDKFYQAASASSQTGFGIGLYLVKHFIEGHGGQIGVQSTPGEGTSFSVSLQEGFAHLPAESLVKDARRERVLLEELAEDPVLSVSASTRAEQMLDAVATERSTILLADDDDSIRRYLRQVLEDRYTILEASDGAEALRLAQEKFPDLVISDIKMEVMNGIELCRRIKSDESLNHIPVVLLTGSRGAELELEGIEGGADVYLTKPFDKDLLLARVENLFKSRNELQNYFFNEITLKKNTLKISPEYKEFLDRCIAIVEKHLDDDQFSIKTLAKELGMSHSNLYRKVKSISGQSVSAFVRFIRLRRAAELMLSSNCNVNEAAFQVGISDIKYFRKQFFSLFGMNPSDYIKKFRPAFSRDFTLNEKLMNPDS